MQHAMYMRHILSSVACPALQYFSTLSHKWHDFRKKKLYWIWNVYLIFYTIFIWNMSHSKKKWARYDTKCVLASCEVPLFLSYFNETWIFRQNFEQFSNIKFLENPFVGSRVFPCGRTDGQIRRGQLSLFTIFRRRLNTIQLVLCTEITGVRFEIHT